MQIPGAGPSERRNTRDFVAAEDAGALEEQAIPLLDRAVGVEWYRAVRNGRRPGDCDPLSAAARARRRARRTARAETRPSGPCWRPRAPRPCSGSRAARSRTWTRPAFRKPSSRGWPRERLTVARSEQSPQRIVARQSRSPNGRSAANARYGASASWPACSPMTTLGPLAEQLARLARRGVDLRLRVDGSVGRRREPVERRARGRIREVLRLGHASRVDALVLVPELDEDHLDRRVAPEAGRRGGRSTPAGSLRR